MTIPIKLRDPNTKVETKQKILINMDVSKKYKYHIRNEYSTYIFGDNRHFICFYFFNLMQ